MKRLSKRIALFALICTIIGSTLPAETYASEIKPLNSYGTVITDIKATKSDSKVTKTPSISQSIMTLQVGKNKKLKMNGTDSSIGKVKWKSSNKSVAKVSSKGKVTAKTTGTAVIVAIYNDEVYTCIVEVVAGDEKKELSAEELFEISRSSMVEITMVTVKGTDSLGSGFFIDKNRILTNYHVIEEAAKLTVKDYNNNTYTIDKIYGYDKVYDMAVLGVKEEGTPLSISYTEPITGEAVYTIGSPYGYTSTFSKGIVALADRILDDVDYIQITAPVSRGNSGGPLLNKYGEVIGVNTLSQIDGQNINFSVKIKYLDKLDVSNPVSLKTFLSTENK